MSDQPPIIDAVYEVLDHSVLTRTYRGEERRQIVTVLGGRQDNHRLEVSAVVPASSPEIDKIRHVHRNHQSQRVRVIVTFVDE